jgi:hypothetical protein
MFCFEEEEEEENEEAKNEKNTEKTTDLRSCKLDNSTNLSSSS